MKKNSYINISDLVIKNVMRMTIILAMFYNYSLVISKLESFMVFIYNLCLISK